MRSPAVLPCLLLLAVFAMPAAAHEDKLAGGEWVLSGERDKNAPSLRFDGGRVAGTGGCNRLMGGYRQEAAGKLSFSQLATTRMACPPKVMEKEQSFLDMLARVRGLRTGNDEIELLDADGKVLAAFTRRIAE